ncbi:hypothetical protein [Streptomyces alboniger]|nr:hypothetical protein [Streptomyces alboniger]
MSRKRVTIAWKSFTVGPATRGMNEHTLDKVRHEDYFVDMRSLPKPARA